MSATSTSTDAPAPEGPATDLSPWGRRLRVLATVVGAGLLLGGTLWGSDDDFPFGPFKMYSHTNRPDGTVNSSRIEAVNQLGERFKLRDSATGLRRAEIEGQLPRFQQDPQLLGAVADAYERRHPDAPELVRVEIIRRTYRLENGRPTGAAREAVVAEWDR